MRATLLLFCSLSAAAQQVITTFAGTDWVFTDEGKIGVNASLAQPVAVATDSKGNLYIVDPFMNSVLKLSTSGVMSIVAGNGLRRSAGDGGPANAALLQNPQGVAVDAAGNIYISESFGSRIRKITPDGLINTLAGGAFGFSGDGGSALQAQLRNPTVMTVDGAGNLYFRDSVNFRIRKIDPTGKITTVAGTGVVGVSGDGGLAAAAQVTGAGGLLADRQGNLYIAELLYCRVRKMDSTGIISTIAGTGACNDSGDNAAATKAQLNQPSGLVMDAQGFLYVSEKMGNRIRRIDPNGIITTTAGVGTDGFSGDGGNSAQAQFSSPVAMAIDSQGNIFVADRDNQRVRRFTYGGNIATVAGNGASIGDGGLAAAARLSFAPDITIDAKGNLYIADGGNQRIRKVTPDGVITTVAGYGHEGFAPDGTLAINAQFGTPFSVAIDPQGNVVFTDNGNQRIRRIKSDGTLQTIAGNGNAGIAGDGGFATQATVSNPQYLRYDGNGNLYFKNGGNQVRVITTDGRINLVAGNGATSYSGDGGPAKNAGIGEIIGMTVDRTGNVYLGDFGSFRVRKVDTSGTITTLAGNGTEGFSGDGGPAKNASIDFAGGVGGILTDGAGNVFFAASTRIRKVAPDGSISTIAGTGRFAYGGDGGLATAAAFEIVGGMVFDAQNNLLAIDYQNTRVREILSGQVPVIGLSQKGITFFAASGSAATPQTFTIVNAALGTINYGISATTSSGGNWLSVSPTQGSVAAGAPGAIETASVDISKLAVGTYYGQITVTAAGVPNSPQSVTVVLNVGAAGTVPLRLSLAPGGLIFTGGAGKPIPAAQALTISTLTSQTLNYAIATSFSNNVTWFTLASSSGTVTAGKPVSVPIQPITSGLAAGVYTATLTVTSDRAPTRQVSLHLIISASSSSAALDGGGGTRAAACTPTRLVPILTSLAAGFNVTASWPIPLDVLVADDCGNPVSTGSVVASFSTGDEPLSLRSSQNGSWGATWQSRVVSTQAQIIIDASQGTPPIKGTTQISGGLGANQDPPPDVATGGVLNAASYTLNSPVAPGSLVSIFGTHLANQLAQATALPLPIDLNGTEVIAAGRNLPLVFVSENQINAMIPYDLPVNATHQLVVTRGGTISLPEPVAILAERGGVFTRNNSGTGAGIVVGVFSDGSQALIDATHPVKAGDVIVIYATGLGDVDPRVIAGAPAPVSPLSTTIDPVIATIGGVPASVVFAGLTPGFTGLYQVNAVVPAGVTPGSSVALVLTQGGNPSPPVNLVVR